VHWISLLMTQNWSRLVFYHNHEVEVSLEGEGSDMTLKDTAERLNMAAELENMDQA